MPVERQAQDLVQADANWIDALARPSAYPLHWGVTSVEVIQTHASVVFLAGDYALKVKKAVDFGFLDYSSLHKRIACCEAEVRQNRRMAQEIYLGVVAVVAGESGWRFACESAWQPSDGAPAADIREVAVWMRKMDLAQNLANILQSPAALGSNPQEDGEARKLVSCMHELAAMLVEHHRSYPAPPSTWVYASYSEVERACVENITDLRATASAASLDLTRLLQRIERLQRDTLDGLAEAIEERHRAGHVCQIHGDLRLEHVYLGAGDGCPTRLSVVDCIEFNPRFQYNDPVADVAFLLMDLLRIGQSKLASAFVDRYFDLSADGAGKRLLPLYATYRSMVRAKVELLRWVDPHVDKKVRDQARELVFAHLHLACGLLGDAAQSGGIILVGGLPGTGKSTLCHALTQTRSYCCLRSDVIRKELLGLSETTSARASLGQGIYDAHSTDHTYEVMISRALAKACAGEVVLLDASWSQQVHRQSAIEAAMRVGVGVAILHCHAQRDICRQRIASRQGDASDADEQVYEAMKQSYSPFSPREQKFLHEVETTDGVQAAILRLPTNLLHASVGW